MNENETEAPQEEEEFYYFEVFVGYMGNPNDILPADVHELVLVVEKDEYYD